MKAEHVKNGVKFVCECVAGLWVIASVFGPSITITKTTKAVKNDNVDCGYYEAVNEIVKSDMLTSSKQEMIEAMLPDGDADYYKAVINIVKSDMLSSSKINMIKSLY